MLSTDPAPAPEPADTAEATSTSRLRSARYRRPLVGLAAAVVILFAGGGLFLSGYSLGRAQATTPGTPPTEAQAFQGFWDAYHAVIDRYAGGAVGSQVDRKTVVEGAIKGMIAALGDPFSAYLTSDEYRRSLQGVSGEFTGIGANIGTEKADGSATTCTTLGPDCRLVVVSPIAGAPAEAAGIRAGDVINAIDGQTVGGQTVDASLGRIRGPKGAPVTLSIVRGSAPAVDIRIVRDVIVQQEVVARDLAGGTIGYIDLTGFSDHATQQFADALSADIGKGRTRIILDLRGNPGGFVTAARSIASQFIASGPIYFQQDAQGTDLEVDAAPGGVATDPRVKLVVLIDKNSASASEIVAGALQDTKRATLVGQTSYGKGTIQQWQPLENDMGGFKLTIAKWLTPDKRWIHGTGLTPDVPVTVPGTTPVGSDPVLDRAIQLLGESPAAVVLRPAA
jgi:carboxyl-terminal processing protease